MKYIMELQKLFGEFMMAYTEYLSCPTDETKKAMVDAFNKSDSCLDKCFELSANIGRTVEGYRITGLK